MTDTAIDRDRPPSGTEDNRSSFLLIAIAVLASMLVVFAVTRGGDGSASSIGDEPTPVDQSEFTALSGLRIEHVGLLGDAGLIEIRYRTMDSDLSSIVHDLDNPPRIVTSDGVELRLPPMEHPHDRVNRLGTTYNDQLVNLGGLVSRGDVVTVYIGQYALAGVTVQ